MARRRLLLAAAALAAALLPAGRGEGAEGDEPYIGYLFPAGLRSGTRVEVTAGGQNLRGVNEAIVSGSGVRARVIEHVPPWRPIDGDTARVIMRALADARDAKLAEAAGRPPPPKREVPVELGPDGKPEKPPPLPDHPLLRDLEKKSLDDLRRAYDYFFKPRNLQQIKRAIAETVRIEVTADPGAAPGSRELRLRTPEGLTNPLRFDVGALPEVVEVEPNDPGEKGPDAVDPPVVWNGQILPKDVDRFRFRAKEGQSLVIRVEARHLIPYQADSVPGWMQAVVALYDEEGNEVAYGDDYRFDPDPVLFFPVRKSGEYVLEVRDSIYRGREDFVYRVAVGEIPFIQRMFPLGGRAGAPTAAKVFGWNLPWTRVELDTAPGLGGIRWTPWQGGGAPTNAVPYAVDPLPEVEEAEPNDAPASAQVLTPPIVVNGRVGKPGDADVFRVFGYAGDEVVAEVEARRLDSPLDSLLRVVDEGGQVVAWNDDQEDRGMGLMTHHADSYVRLKLPKNGAYFVRLSDAQQHGGDEYAYRLRVSPPRPDFALVLAPSSLNLRAGTSEVVTVHALRRDGFDGDIDVALKDAPAGFRLDGAVVPGGRDRVRMTLTAPRDAFKDPLTMGLEGRAKIGGQAVARAAVPAEDVMQAFAYRHLVPSQSWMVAVRGAGRMAPDIAVEGGGPLRVPSGGSARLRVRAPGRVVQRDIHLELQDPPKGVSLEDVAVTGDGVDLVIRADAKLCPAGYADNLIVEVYAGPPPPRQGAKRPKAAAEAAPRVLVGILPAIPFEVFRR